MARMMGYALMLGGYDAWSGFATVAMARMTIEERAALAWAALRSLESPDQAELVAEHALQFSEGPLPSFLNPMEDARLWASLIVREQIADAAPVDFNSWFVGPLASLQKRITEESQASSVNTTKSVLRINIANAAQAAQFVRMRADSLGLSEAQMRGVE